MFRNGYRQYRQVMYLSGDGWQALRDDAKRKIEFDSPAMANGAAEELERQEGVTDTMVIKVEQFEAYDFVTRQPMYHTIYTGLTNG